MADGYQCSARSIMATIEYKVRFSLLLKGRGGLFEKLKIVDHNTTGVRV
jgi:hypothetical protein